MSDVIRPIRVLVMAPAFPPVVGGAESFVEAVTLGLVESAVEVHIVTGNQPRPPVAGHVCDAGGSVTVLEGRPAAGAIEWEHQTFWRSERLWAIVDEHGVDVVHAFSHDTAVTAAIVKSGRPGLGLVASFGEISTEGSPAGIARSRFVYGLPHVDAVVAGSRHYASIARRHGTPESRIKLIPSGIDVETFASGSREHGRALLKVGPGELLLVCPSRFTPRKGQLELVEAVARLVPSHPEVRLVLLGSVSSGSAEYLEAVRAEVRRRGLGDRVWLRLEVPREQLPSILAAADLVVQPSHLEGLGTAALEAMAAGACTLLTRTSGFDEIAEHGVTAHLVQPQDPEALAAAIAHLADRPERRQELAAAARRFVAEHYSRRDMVGRLVALYAEVAAPAVRDVV
jgi:glycosyltransferase involved in cell wall biosynthesis